ncbi:MAG: 8-oxo-dGTP diphosphatase MutT [Gammaproteobacteria bacterium]
MTAQKRVHVLVGLIRDERGRWLVNQRRAGTHMAGLWEFPGGKSQPGEAPFAALRRELDEELGIDVQEAAAWFELAHDYPDKHVRLDIWRVRRFTGEVVPREGQLLRWIAVDEFAALPLVEGDWPIVERLQQIAS